MRPHAGKETPKRVKPKKAKKTAPIATKVVLKMQRSEIMTWRLTSSLAGILAR